MYMYNQCHILSVCIARIQPMSCTYCICCLFVLQEYNQCHMLSVCIAGIQPMLYVVCLYCGNTINVICCLFVLRENNQCHIILCCLFVLWEYKCTSNVIYVCLYCRYQVDYQLGVFISRSSVNLLEIKKLWILPILQVCVVVLTLSTLSYFIGLFCSLFWA